MCLDLPVYQDKGNLLRTWQIWPICLCGKALNSSFCRRGWARRSYHPAEQRHMSHSQHLTHTVYTLSDHKNRDSCMKLAKMIGGCPSPGMPLWANPVQSCWMRLIFGSLVIRLLIILECCPLGIKELWQWARLGVCHPYVPLLKSSCV